MSPRGSDAELLNDITEAASVAARIVARGRAAFDADPVLRYAAEAVAARIGEAATNLSDETTAAISEVPWREIMGIRVVIAHAYHRIRYDQLWQTLATDIPALLAAIERHRG